MFIAVTVATLGAHLGLFSAIVRVLSKIAKCERCAAMWLSLSVLLYSGCDLFAAIALSILGAYLSFYLGLVLMVLNKIYNSLWQKINKQK
jgi:hypothetical protein